MRENIIRIILFLAQLLVCFVVLNMIYIFFAFLDCDWNLDERAIAFLIHPIFSVIFSVVTILFCLFIGMPLRIFAILKRFRNTHWYLPIAGVFAGIIMLMLSHHPEFREYVTYTDGNDEMTKQISNVRLFMSGWFLLAFSILFVIPGKNGARNEKEKSDQVSSKPHHS